MNSTSRLRLAETPGGLELLIVPQRQWSALLLLPIWTAGWFLGAAHIVRTMVNSAGRNLAFNIAWLALWSLAGVWLATSLLWVAAGREIAVLTANQLTLRREIFGFGHTRTFFAPEMRAPRYRRERIHAHFTDPGCVVFEYGTVSCEFGSGLSEPEVQQIIALMEQRLNVKPATRQMPMRLAGPTSRPA